MRRTPTKDDETFVCVRYLLGDLERRDGVFPLPLTGCNCVVGGVPAITNSCTYHTYSFVAQPDGAGRSSRWGRRRLGFADGAAETSDRAADPRCSPEPPLGGAQSTWPPDVPEVCTDLLRAPRPRKVGATKPALEIRRRSSRSLRSRCRPSRAPATSEEPTGCACPGVSRVLRGGRGWTKSEPNLAKCRSPSGRRRRLGGSSNTIWVKMWPAFDHI